MAKAYYKTGDVSISNLRNNDITFSANTKQNNYGIMINAATEYRKYAKEDGITQPSNIKFWAYFYRFLLTKRYFEDYKTTIDYTSILKDTDNIREYCYFYYPAYYDLYSNNKLSISQIFFPYTKFSVKSAKKWYDMLTKSNSTMDLNNIKTVLIEKGALL